MDKLIADRHGGDVFGKMFHRFELFVHEMRAKIED